jgi:hypothetical protein
MNDIQASQSKNSKDLEFLKGGNYTRDTLPTSWKCEPLNMTMDEINKIKPKTFVPYGGMSFDICKVSDKS